jgi:hypothetical protein
MARVLVIGGLSMLALAGFIALKTPLGNGMDRLIALALTAAGILDLMVALNLSRRSR